MGLTEKEAMKIKSELDTCKRPLYFFHDDPDGLCSFLLFYRYVKEGKGVIVKARPRIDEKYLRKVDEYQPDKIFILDIAIVDQDFLDQVKVPVIWVDHHDPLDRDKVKYFNPRVHNPKNNIPASYLCYQVVKDELPEAMWISMTGCIGDWFMPDFHKEFCKKFPELLSSKVERPEVALFDSTLGKFIRILAFILKGKTSDAMKCAKILTRIEDPYEVLEQKTPRGKFIFRYFEKINKEYENLLEFAINEVGNQKKKRKKILVVSYPSGKISFVGDLSNEMLYRFPKNIVVVAREVDGEMKASLRSPANINVAKILPKALFGLQGYGGGHEHACGACVKREDWDQFIHNLEEEIFR